MGTVDEEGEMGDVTEADRWTHVFTHSRIAPEVFNLTYYRYDDVMGVLDAAGMPEVKRSGVFSNSYTSRPLLDGWVISLFTHGFPAGGLSSGTRLIGFRPFRLLCHLLDLTPPRRLKGESAIPPVEDLLEEFALQQSQPKQVLTSHAHRALGISDPAELYELINQQWGEK